MQDDWAASARLTLNLGLRYDLGKGSLEDIVYKPFVPAGPGADKNNFGPRAGFAYRLNDKTVVRGGVGKYFANEDENTVFWSMLTQGTISVQQLYDGRPDFAARPFNGPIPTYDQEARGSCPIHIWRRHTATSRQWACSASSAAPCHLRRIGSTPATESHGS
jgi:hypothetical protein